MKVDWASELASGPWTVCANLPYNVAVPLVLTILEQAPTVARIVVMVQREVGERFAAAPGQEGYGAVSVRVAYRAAATIVRRVPASVFWPRPKVASVVVRFDRLDAPPVDVEPERLWRVVDAGFAERRKTMRNALRRLGLDLERGRRRAGRVRGGARRRAPRSSTSRRSPRSGRRSRGERPRDHASRLREAERLPARAGHRVTTATTTSRASCCPSRSTTSSRCDPRTGSRSRWPARPRRQVPVDDTNLALVAARTLAAALEPRADRGDRDRQADPGGGGPGRGQRRRGRHPPGAPRAVGRGGRRRRRSHRWPRPSAPTCRRS